MVGMTAKDGQQVPKAILNIPDPIRELRQPHGEFRESPRLERSTVHDDAATFAERIG
jgi:hypothetical protein